MGEGLPSAHSQGVFLDVLSCLGICVWAAEGDKGFQKFLLLSPRWLRNSLLPPPPLRRGEGGKREESLADPVIDLCVCH